MPEDPMNSIGAGLKLRGQSRLPFSKRTIMAVGGAHVVAFAGTMIIVATRDSVSTDAALTAAE